MSEPMTPFERRLADELCELVEEARLNLPPTAVVSDAWRRQPAPSPPARFGRRIAGLAAAAAVVFFAIVVLPRLAVAPAMQITPPPSAAPGSPPPQAGRLVWVESVSLSEDRTVVHIRWTGGPPFDPADPCSDDYEVSARVVGGELHIAVREVTIARTQPILSVPMGCPAVGYPREADVVLAASFEGHLVRDLAGYVIFLSRPPDMAVLDLPPEWQLVSEGPIGSSPTGRWQQRFSRLAQPREDGVGTLSLVQGFGGPANVQGIDPLEPVTVNGARAALWSWEAGNELTLEWPLGPHGLALTVTDADFSVEKLIALAETARLPDGAAQPVTGADLLFSQPAGSEGIGLQEVAHRPEGPAAIATDHEGTVWIADTVNKRVVAYSPRGERVDVIEPGDIVRSVSDVAVYADEAVAILDMASVPPRVAVFDRATHAVQTTTDLPPDLGLEAGLSGIAYGPRGELLVELGGRAASQLGVDAGTPLALTERPTRQGGLRIEPVLLGGQPSQRSEVTYGSLTFTVEIEEQVGAPAFIGESAAGLDLLITALARSTSGEIVLAQHVHRYDAAGNLLWAWTPPTESHDYVTRRFATAPDGRLVVLSPQADRVDVLSATVAERHAPRPLPPEALPTPAPTLTNRDRSDTFWDGAIGGHHTYYYESLARDQRSCRQPHRIAALARPVGYGSRSVQSLLVDSDVVESPLVAVAVAKQRDLYR